MIFLGCTRMYESVNDIPCRLQSSMLHCPASNKCIPNRYVMDTIPDCYGAFDESLSVNSCSLNDKYRFHCTSEKKCLLTTAVNNGIRQCSGGEDELGMNGLVINIQTLAFSAICDGRREVFASTNETDETHCEEWSCVNQYTQCDGLWQCPKGIDEINCLSKINCPTDHHPCVFPSNQTIGCLHLNRIDDGIVDCLGATDERTHCRLSYPTDGLRRYRCWNDTLCVFYGFRCHECNKVDGIDELCQADNDKNSDILKYFDDMLEVYHARKLPFSPQSSDPFPRKQSLPSTKNIIEYQKREIEESTNTQQLDMRQVWLCHQGTLIYVGENESEQCLCPPNYYGDRCQYQNQRVSLTLRIQNENLGKFIVIGIIASLVDNTGLIHSYEQFTYVPVRDCNTKFDIYLLYRDRPKDMTKNYTINIEAYDKLSFRYLSTWTFPVKFNFMPVNRESAILTIPASQNCHKTCNSKYREQFKSNKIESCRCKSNHSEIVYINQDQCNCSPDSICVGIANNRSICLCPLTKISPRCLLNSICQTDVCSNRGVCVPDDDRISLTNFTCICQDGFSGPRCEEKDVEIDISFSDVPIPQSLLVHFITAQDYSVKSENPIPTRATMFKKIGFDQDAVTFYMSLPFHLVFAQIEIKFYLIVLQHEHTPSINISTEITRSRHCPYIRELFDQQTIDYQILRRVKFYHLPCKTNLNLICFHDNETFICLCTKERNANCFHFDFNMTYNCMGWNDCQNGGQCFQDHPTCPTKTMCICQACFYGTKCQFSTKQFGLSLDVILGYKILPHIRITQQSLYVIGSIVLATIMLVVGLISGILCIWTFQSKSCLRVGSGLYLLASSITSILILITLNLKLWFLVFSQMSTITSLSFLSFSCISIEFILRSLLAITDWFHASVAVERLFTVILGVNFNLTKSKNIGKWNISFICLITMISLLHEPIYRRLIDDEEEKRTWCLVRFTPKVESYNSFINIFHFVIPFSIKFISIIAMIIFLSRRRASVKKQDTYMEHFRKQLHTHKYLILSSLLSLILALPRLVIAFIFGCMTSAREPLIPLTGYFVSFIPSLLTFFIFVLTSTAYKKQFNTVVTRKWEVMRRWFQRQ
ncbi:unnamed protein product [Rotaria sp. Silwood2]|nr:unnamed protein product [Rotaria sp. Silwood2]